LRIKSKRFVEEETQRKRLQNDSVCRTCHFQAAQPRWSPCFGRYYQNKDFGVVGAVGAVVDAGKVTVYCPDVIDLESSTTNQSIQPIACALITRMKM
jgi:esterase/lipase superfamily enzyme